MLEYLVYDAHWPRAGSGGYSSPLQASIDVQKRMSTGLEPPTARLRTALLRTVDS
jgi:hypothetical protein